MFLLHYMSHIIKIKINNTDKNSIWIVSSGSTRLKCLPPRRTHLIASDRIKLTQVYIAKYFIAMRIHQGALNYPQK